MIALEEVFANQKSESVEDKFLHMKDSKTFFCKQDGLHNLENDLVFSILGKYHCEAGCKICFLNDQWIDRDKVVEYVPSENQVNEKYKAKLKGLFSNFETIACIDDLVYLKKNHEHLFDFYKDMAPLMEFHMTDNSFFSHYKILMEDIHFKDIGQVSFSDELLAKRDGKIVDKIIEMLRLLNDRSPIGRVNFIITEENPQRNKNLMKLCDWLLNIDETLKIYFHSDVRGDRPKSEWLRKVGYREPSCYYMETSVTPSINCSILSETVHLRFDEFYLDLYTSMDLKREGFLKFEDNLKWETFLTSMLFEKINMYKRNISVMKVDNEIKKYFREVVLNLKINENFNFIPEVLLSPYSKLYKKLAKENYKNTYAGLIKKDAKDVKSIIEWHDR